jgi:peptide chain release factor subunit 3
MSGQQGGFNPGAYAFRPGGQQPFVPRAQQGQPGQQPSQPGQYDQYAAYGQQGYPQQGYPQQQYGAGYGGQQQYHPQQQAYVPGAQQAYVPGAQQSYVPPSQQQPQQRTYEPRSVKGFTPPSFTPGPPVGTSSPSLSIGGGAKAPASLSIGGGAKAAPSLSIGGDKPKAAASLSIGGGGVAGKPAAAPSLSIGKKEDSTTATPAAAPTEKKSTPAPSVPAPTPAASSKTEADDIDEEFAPKATPAAAAPAATEPAAESSAPATDAAVKVVEGSTGGQNSVQTTNFSKVSAKNDAEAVYKEQAAAGVDAMRDLYGDDGMKDPNIKGHMNIIFTGHVDAGKSTMGGQLLYLTGAVDKRTMQKYEQEAKAAGKDTWYLSWALDSGKEERAQGKTVEVGRAYFETEKRRYTILDAPGHKTFVPSMITGAAQADIAMLVLSARKGEFETGFDRDGQTREHAVLIKNNGISKLVILINKMDDPTVNWAQER